MTRYCMTLAAALILAGAARADDGIVMSVRGDRAVIKMGLDQVRIGEEVSLEIVPRRDRRTGRAVVTDIDLRTSDVALVLLSGRSYRGSRRGGAYPELSARRSNLRSRRLAFILFDRDAVVVTGLNRYASNPPRFRLRHPEPSRSGRRSGIDMPRGLAGGPAAGGSAIGARPTPAPAGNPSDATPGEIDNLLRTLPQAPVAGESQNP